MGDSAREFLQWWLPDLKRCAPDHPLRQVVARADRQADGARGYLGGLPAWFDAPGGLASAALTREAMAGDAGQALWLSADPAWVQPEMNGARLLACGQLGLSAEEATALATALAPVWAEAGMVLHVSTPDRWHLRLPEGSEPPSFASPEQALGEDLFEHLPQGDAGRRWRWLLNETQVLLHQHAVNQARRERGLPTVNSLWLWGAGRLPERVITPLAGVISDDALLSALAARAGIAVQARSNDSMADAAPGWLLDLQDQSFDAIAQAWASLSVALSRQPVQLIFASGERWLHRPWHRWRFWRKVGA